MDGTGTAKRHQRVVSGIAPPLDRDDPHGTFHIGIGDGVDTPGSLAHRESQGIRDEVANSRLGRGTVE